MRISDWSSDVCSSDHSRGSTDKREKRQMKWNKFIRQVHRWLSILFTLIVAAIFLTLGLGRAPAEWVYFLPLAPLALMLFTGLWMFVLPYAARARRAIGGAACRERGGECV